jgi:drug/metabolite transporter (DMT)-like permease
MLSDNRKGILFMAAASVCWSFGGLFIKLIPWSAMSIIGLRSLLGAAVVLIYRRKIKTEFTTGNILGALCLAATITLFVFANKLTTAAAAILLQFSAPVFILLIQFIFHKTKPKLSELIAVTATFAGIVLFFADRLEGGALLGNILAIGSGMSFAGLFVCNKRPDTKPDQVIFLGFLLSAALGLPFAFTEVTLDLPAWGSVIFLGVVQVGLAYVFFSVGIKKISALLACLITAMEPVLNPLWAAIFINEIPGMFTILGGAVIILSVVSYNVWLERGSR